MAWIRLDDDYFYHPKFATLSHVAFRLWHEGLVYCRKLMTDGLITTNELKAFRYFTRKAVRELSTPRGQAEPLWVPDPAGYRVHDYLDWNASQAEEQQEREATKLRVRAYRSKWRPPLSNTSGNGVRNALSNAESNGDVRGQGQGSGSSLEKGSGEKPLRPPLSLAPDLIAERAGSFLRHYAELYTKHRHGAKLRLIGNSVEFEEACSVVAVWDDARLEKLAVVFLQTDDPFISGTDRSFKIFAMKASWADDKLKVWELEHGVAH